MSKRQWSVRKYQPGDLDAIQELFTVVFHSTRPKEHFIWKFHDNPAGQGIIVVAERSGQIVGQYALMPTRLRLGTDNVYGAQSLDTMTHPDYRNQGMFTVLAKTCIETAASMGIEALYGFPNENSYHGFVDKLNWDHTGDIPRFVRVLNPTGITAMSRPMKYLTSLGLHLLPSGNNAAPLGIEIRSEKPTDEELLSLAELTALGDMKGTCRIRRSLDWFKWRFDPKSQRSYVWFSAYCDGKLKAWAAFGTNDWGEIPLIDMCGSDGRALETVGSRATRRAKELRLPALIAVTNDRGVAHALKSCGYFRHGTEPLIVRSLTSRTLDGNIHLHSSWRISSQDVDTF